MASVRFICGTQDLHKELEKKIADFFGKEDTILYAACFDANGGLFELLLRARTPSSPTRSTTRPSSTASACARPSASATPTATWPTSRPNLAADAAGARTKLITTDGAFSMDGFIALLVEIVALAKKYDALVHIDECHCTGFLGDTGRGSGVRRARPDRHHHRHPGKARRRSAASTTAARKSSRCSASARVPLPVLQLAAADTAAAGTKVFDVAAAGDLRAQVK